jgi:hypothetical protein
MLQLLEHHYLWEPWQELGAKQQDSLLITLSTPLAGTGDLLDNLGK